MFEKIKLDYDFDSLEPFIDTHTLGLHYNKHYLNYLNNLNKLLIKNNITYNNDISALLNELQKIKTNDIDDILFNLGGVLNHELYFKSIGKKSIISDVLKNEIENEFGSYENFVKLFSESANKLKGSGYTFLVINNKKLEIINIPNQVTPYLYGLISLLCIDLWEHAYYINYENRKKDYIENFFNIIDFSSANDIFYKNKIV